MVVPGWEEEHFLRRRCLNHAPGLGGDAGGACKRTEIERFQVGEGVVGAFDGHHCFVCGDLVAFAQGTHGERLPAFAGKLDDRHRLVDTAKPAIGAAEHLHQHAWTVPVGSQHTLGVDEVAIRIRTRTHGLDGQVEDSRMQTGAAYGPTGFQLLAPWTASSGSVECLPPSERA